MKRIIIIYGLIAGAIIGTVMLATMPLYSSGALNFDNGAIVGYSSMVIGLSLVFFGVKNYRDNHLGGKIGFGKAFVVGMLIVLVASIIYCVAWEVCYRTVASDFIQEYSEHYINEIKESGATEDVLASKQKEMDEFTVLYQNPLVRFGMTLLEIMPVGLLITLISSYILRKREPATT